MNRQDCNQVAGSGDQGKRQGGGLFTVKNKKAARPGVPAAGIFWLPGQDSNLQPSG